LPTDLDFEAFKGAVSRLVEGEESDTAFLWDRVGHWAQYDGNWQEAERAYRIAYDIEPDRYGYCLGTALNFLSRYSEALSILIPQAVQHQADAMSWFQVAIAHGGLRDFMESIAAYQRAIDMDEEYDLAWFNLGGAYWNSGEKARATETWGEAVRRFPDHELTSKLRRFHPTVFGPRHEV
jgi:tetratricopeptide (TPR) repeat protein